LIKRLQFNGMTPLYQCCPGCDSNLYPPAVYSVSATFGGIVERYGPRVADNLDITQQQFSNFICSENLRLNKLISNLYLKLAMTDLPDEDLFGSVCHSVAEYFHCEAVSLFLRHHEEAAPDAGGVGIESTLQRYGAFGAWDRALKSPFVRRSEPIAYAIPEQPSQSGVHDTVCESADAETSRARQEAGTAGGNQSSHPLPHGRGSLFSTDSQPDFQSASCTPQSGTGNTLLTKMFKTKGIFTRLVFGRGVDQMQYHAHGNVQILRTLARIGTPKAVKLVQRTAISHPNPFLRSAAKDALKNLKNAH